MSLINFNGFGTSSWSIHTQWSIGCTPLGCRLMWMSKLGGPVSPYPVHATTLKQQLDGINPLVVEIDASGSALRLSWLLPIASTGEVHPPAGSEWTCRVDPSPSRPICNSHQPQCAAMPEPSEHPSLVQLIAATRATDPSVVQRIEDGLGA